MKKIVFAVMAFALFAGLQEQSVAKWARTIIVPLQVLDTVRVKASISIGDKGYLSATIQLDLFETSGIRLEVPYRLNQKDWKPTFKPFAKARKRIKYALY